MGYELREGQGSLFRNKQKETGDNKPNLTGEAKVNGIVYRVSAWTKLTKNGEKWLSLNIQPPKDQDVKQYESPKEGLDGVVEMDSDLPF